MKKIFNYIKKIFSSKKEKEGEVLKVKIVKCENIFSWYNKKIGEVFLVKRVAGEELFRTIENNVAGNNHGFIKNNEAIVL